MSKTDSQRTNAGKPSILVNASRAIISASVLKWEIAPYFLHIHVRVTKVFGPTRHTRPPLVLLLPRKSEAKLASEKIITRTFSALSPMKLIKEYCVVWCKYDIKRCNRLSHATFQEVTSLAKTLTVHKQSTRAILARSNAVKTIREATGASLPFVSKSSGCS